MFIDKNNESIAHKNTQNRYENHNSNFCNIYTE